MSGTRKRHQHVVPKVYLRGFADDNEMVSVRRRTGANLNLHISNVAVRKNFYSFTGDDETQNDAIEEWFASDVEAPIGRILPRLRSGSRIEPDDVGPLATFTACQLMRTASTRLLMEQIDSHLGPQLVLHEVFKKHDLDPVTMTKESLDQLTAIARKAWTEHQNSDPEAERLSRLRTTMRKIDELTLDLNEWTWTTLQSDEPVLITGDSPAVAFEPSRGFTGIIPAGSPVYLPLSPHLLLVAERHPLTTGDAQQATRPHAAEPQPTAGTSDPQRSVPTQLAPRERPPLSRELAQLVNARIASEADDALSNTPSYEWPAHIYLAKTRPTLAPPTVTWRRSEPETPPTFPTTYSPVASPAIRNLLQELGATDEVA